MRKHQPIRCFFYPGRLPNLQTRDEEGAETHKPVWTFASSLIQSLNTELLQEFSGSKAEQHEH
jgi:hypothetical protein